MKAYVVRGKIAADKPNLKIKAGDPVWLTWDNEGGGWYQWSSQVEWAHPFTSKAKAKQAVRGCPGPWFNEPSPHSIELIDADYTPAKGSKLVIHDAR